MNNIQTFEEFVNENKLNEYGRYPDFSILPLGSVNIKTGKCKYFDIYDTYDGSVEFWDDTQKPGNYRLVFTSGEGPILNKGGKDEPKKDDIRPFNHDQTFKPMFVGKFISWCRVSELKDVAATMGIKSALGYTYK